MYLLLTHWGFSSSTLKARTLHILTRAHIDWDGNVPEKSDKPQKGCFGKEEGKCLVEEHQLTLSSARAWRCHDGPATARAGRQWQRGAGGEGTSTSPAVWSQSALTPLGGNSTPPSWIPKAKGGKRLQVVIMLENYIVHCTQIFSFLTARMSWTSVLRSLREQHTEWREQVTGTLGLSRCSFANSVSALKYWGKFLFGYREKWNWDSTSSIKYKHNLHLSLH